MAESGGYTIENEYQSGYNSFEPGSESPYLGKDALVKAGEMGMTTDPRSANQLAQLSTTLNQGVIPVEVGAISPQVFDQIPKQHFEEMKRKAKLTGAQLSLHAPIIDPAGIGERGWDESQRELAERQFKDVVDKAYLLKENDKDMPITMHATNSSGSIYKMTPEGKKLDMMIAIDKETGQLVPIKETPFYIPDGKGVKEKLRSPEKRLKMQNEVKWEGELDKVIFQKEFGDKVLTENYPAAKELYMAYQNNPDIFSKLPEGQQQVLLNIRTANTHLNDAQQVLGSIFSKAYEFGNPEIKKNLEKAGKDFTKNLTGFSDNFKDLSNQDKQKSYLIQSDLQHRSKAIQLFTDDMKKINPNMLQQVEEFATEHAAKTFSNVALHAYDKYGNNAPTISIENLYQGMGFSQAEAMDKLLIETKKKFVDGRMKLGDSESSAKKTADKVIGMTFDMGHANLSRQHGFTSKDIVKEAEMIAKHVKHIHVTDNFGYSDSHLPPGMGNVPVREVLEALEKKGVNVTKINEVAGWFEHFKTSPFQYILEAGGSPIYSSGAGPYWSQATGFQQGYSEGYGMMLPSTHHQIFGAGFSQLPKELGGQAGQRSGMGGKPME